MRILALLKWERRGRRRTAQRSKQGRIAQHKMLRPRSKLGKLCTLMMVVELYDEV